MKLLERTIELYRSMKNPSWEGSFLYGGVNVNESLISLFNDYGDDLEVEFENEQGDLLSPEDLVSYSFVHVKFLPPRKEFSFFAKDFEDYLANFSFRTQVADEFYISDLDGFCSDKKTNNNFIRSYLKIIDLYGLLSRISDHTDKDESNSHKHIILTVSGKEEIPVVYGFDDICKFYRCVDAVDIVRLEEEVFSAPHKSAKISLLKKSIAQYLAPCGEYEKFPTLVAKFIDIQKTYSNNYDLFVNEFSFEDEKEKLEKNKREYLLKLNEILGGVHGKLLAVPVSLVIVAGQMKPSTVENYYLINIIILIGALVFALLMWMLTANQLHSLLAVKTEYESKKERLRLYLRNSLYNDLSNSFDQLDSRFKHQRWMIRFVDLLVLIGLIFSFLVFEYHTHFLANIL
jgi:hypothetical protein